MVPETVSRRNPIMVYDQSVVHKTSFWQTLRPCPECGRLLFTDGRYFRCDFCEWTDEPEEVTAAKKRHQGIKWTDEEDEELIKRWSVDSPEQLMRRFKRSMSALRGRTVALRRRGREITPRPRYKGGRRKVTE